MKKFISYNLKKSISFFMIAAMLLTIIPLTASAVSSAGFYDGELYLDSAKIYGLPAETSASAFFAKVTDDSAALKDKNGEAVAKDSGAYVATGMTLSLSYSSSTFVILGDVSGDGRITTIDYLCVKRLFLGKTTFSGAYAKAADVDCDGTVTATDYIKIKTLFKDGVAIKYTYTDSEETDPDWMNKGRITFAGSSVSVSGEGVTADGTSVTITAGGDFKVTGRSTTAMITVNSDAKVKLRLSGCDLSNSSGPVINFAKVKKAYITLSEGTVNYLSDGVTYSVDGKATVFSENDLEIKGSGSMYITGNYKHGIACDADLVMENGNITIDSAKTDGLHINNSITVAGGTLTVKSAGSDGIECAGTKSGEKGTIAVSGGTVRVVKSGGTAVKALGAVSVTGGSLKIDQAETAIKTSSNFGMNAGSVDIVCNGNGIKAIGAVQISGKSSIKIITQNDGIDGNASVLVMGGTIDIDAADKTIQSDGKVTLNGGTFVLTGGEERLYSATGEITVSTAAVITAK